MTLPSWNHEPSSLYTSVEEISIVNFPLIFLGVFHYFVLEGDATSSAFYCLNVAVFRWRRLRLFSLRGT